MSKTYFIRIRGKSQGPYSAEQLRGFVKRGQLSRLHEVSIDGATWARAANYPDLFASGDVVTADSLGLAPEPAAAADFIFGMGETTNPPPKADRPTRPMQSGSWFYTANGAECGPVDFATLQKLLTSGHLGAQVQVWTEGMDGWAPAHTIAGLSNDAARPGTVLDDLKDLSSDARRGLYPAADAGNSGEVSAEACRAIAGTRPWMLFIAIVGYVVATLLAVRGVLTISSANGNFGLLGLSLIVEGVLVATGATLLVSCFNRFGDVLHSRGHRDLEQGLHALRQFWLFSGIVLIVVLSLLAIFVLVVLAIDQSLVHLLSAFGQ